MDKVRFLIHKKPLLVTLASILLLTTALGGVVQSQANKVNEQKVALQRRVAREWIDVATEQYNKGLFAVSEKYFLRAKDYEQYLMAAERELITGKLREIADRLAERKRIGKLYNHSIKLYRAGQLEKAREGFLKVFNSSLQVAPEGKTAEDYLAKIDHVLVRQAKPSVTDEQPEIGGAVDESPKADKPALAILEDELLDVKLQTAKKVEPQVVQEQEKPVVAAAEPKAPEQPTGKGKYIDAVKRKRNILQSHTKAVVNDAVAKAQSYISQGRFDKAKEAVRTAQRTVNRNHLHLGEDNFKQYNGRLEQLTEQIVQQQNESMQHLKWQKRAESTEAQRRYRQQMEVDRNKRISELMDNALAYQKQQRYEEALGQLESLLAIAPLNNHGLILKQTLEDVINFRKQLEVQKESNRERVGTLIKTDEAMIPYANELTYPKNWREIVAKRKPEEAIGKNPADIAVYKQLEQIVDLSELSPEMPLSEAIEELRNAVDPPLRIVVLWRDLYDNADVDQTTPINMDPISTVPLGAALKLLLKSVSGGFAEFGYVVEDGVITIATEESLPSELVTLVYDVTDLLGRPAAYYAQSGGDVSVGGEGEAGGEGFQQQEELTREQLEARGQLRGDNLVLLIQETVNPDDWYDAGGEGTITLYGNKKLIVRQTREIHNKIDKLLKEMRKSLGHQVSIEARFLLVGENFLEDIGLDIDISRPPLFQKIGEREVEAPEYQTVYDIFEQVGWTEDGTTPIYREYRLPIYEGEKTFSPLSSIKPTELTGTYEDILESTGRLGALQQHFRHTLGEDTGLPGSWPSVIYPLEGGAMPGLALTLGGMILDTLQVDMLLQATQAHKDSKTLTAPKVSVLSGESATMRVQRVTRYPLDIEIDLEEIGEFGDYIYTINYEQGSIITGTILNITPTITQDRKNVLLNIVAEMRDFLGWENYPVQLPIIGEGVAGGGIYSILYPETEISRVETRVSVPDGGTLLLGGQKLTAEVEKESGVPILSKVPILGRLFSNRSIVKDQKILLILVKPTIILQEEAEAEAIAAMQ